MADKFTNIEVEMSEVQSLARGLQIIEKLAQSKESLSITELADEYGVDKGSISRMMQTLANYGFAEREQDGRKYILGPSVVRLSRMLLMRTPLRDTAKIYLKQLVATDWRMFSFGNRSPGASSLY